MENCLHGWKCKKNPGSDSNIHARQKKKQQLCLVCRMLPFQDGGLFAEPKHWPRKCFQQRSGHGLHSPYMDCEGELCGKYLMSHTSTIFFAINPVFSPSSAWPFGLCAFFVLVIHSLNGVVFFYRTPPLPFYISPFLSCSLEPTQRIHIQNGLKRFNVFLHHTKACTIWIYLLLFLHPRRCSDDILFPFFSFSFTARRKLLQNVHRSFVVGKDFA